jgi:hypothetical protein
LWITRLFGRNGVHSASQGNLDVGSPTVLRHSSREDFKTIDRVDKCSAGLAF